MENGEVLCYDTNSYPEMTEIEELESIYCEMHKDVFGVKARWIKFSSVEEGRASLDQLGEMLRLEVAFQQEAETVAKREFEQRVTSTIQAGAKDRATALRWIHQAEDTNGDNESLCYRLGLPYNYFKKVA